MTVTAAQKQLIKKVYGTVLYIYICHLTLIFYISQQIYVDRSNTNSKSIQSHSHKLCEKINKFNVF